MLYPNLYAYAFVNKNDNYPRTNLSTLLFDDSLHFISLRTADAFPIVAEGEQRRPEMRLLFAG